VFEQLSAVISIIIIDLVLSGDNAVVIGMASRSLSPENRRKAIILGGAGAIGLRILFTVLATILLGIPYLQAIGAVLLIYIAFKLIRPQEHSHTGIKEAGSLREAIQTIVLADVVMSLDNILAVAGAAKGHLGLLMFGLLLSIPILLFGSELVARLMGRYPALLYIGVYVLVHAAVVMFLHDQTFSDRFHTNTLQELVIALALTALLVAVVKMLERVGQRRAVAVAADDGSYRGGPPGALSHDGHEPLVPARPGDESSRQVST
jgi:YjbE family integral membrane protein